MAIQDQQPVNATASNAAFLGTEFIRGGVGSTATAGGTTSLTSSSATVQEFTGTLAQNVQLPDATTLGGPNHNTGAWFLVINNSTGALAIKDGSGATIKTMLGSSSLFFVCKNVATAAGAWVIQAASSGGGGGGGSLQWIEDANAPTALVENSRRIYAYQAGLAQILWATIAVPNGYVAGSPINLRMGFYSPDSSGNVLIKTVATLNRIGTDAVSSTTNQRTSTNAAVTLGAGTVNKFQAVVMDLSSSTGQINGVAVSPGDEILVQLTRDASDTATSDAKVAVYKAEPTFS